MPIGFIASLILHGVLLGWALLAVITTPPLNIQTPQPVEVALVTEGDIVRLKQGDREAKLLEAEGKDGPAKEPPKKDPPKPAPPPPQAAAPPPSPPPSPPPVAAEPAPPLEPAKVEPPKPDPIAEKLAAIPPPPEPKLEPKVEPKPEPKVDLGPSPDDQKKLEEKLKEQERADAAAAAAKAVADAKAKADAKARADAVAKAKAIADAKAKALADAKAKEAAKPKDLASVVNDALQATPDKSTSNAPPKALIDRRAVAAQTAGQKTAANAKGPAAGAPEGTDNVLTADKASMLAILMKNNVRRCWNINAGLEGASKLVVKLEVKLNQSGQLVGEPRVTNSGAGQQFEDAVNSARRAVIDCQPYTNLPPDLYAGGWDYMLLILDPAKMF